MIESSKNRERDTWYRMFGKSCKKNMRVRYAMLSIKFLPPKGYSPMHTKQQKQYRRIANNNVKHAMQFQSI